MATNERWNLHAIWRADGENPAKRHEVWLQDASAVEFGEFIARCEGTAMADLFHTDANGDTWAHWQIGMAYVQWVSPAFSLRCIDVFSQYCEDRCGDLPIEEAVWDCREIGDQAAAVTCGSRSLAAWKRCPKPLPSVPL